MWWLQVIFLRDSKILQEEPGYRDRVSDLNLSVMLGVWALMVMDAIMLRMKTIRTCVYHNIGVWGVILFCCCQTIPGEHVWIRDGNLQILDTNNSPVDEQDLLDRVFPGCALRIQLLSMLCLLI